MALFASPWGCGRLASMHASAAFPWRRAFALVVACLGLGSMPKGAALETENWVMEIKNPNTPLLTQL